MSSFKCGSDNWQLFSRRAVRAIAASPGRSMCTWALADGNVRASTVSRNGAVCIFTNPPPPREKRNIWNRCRFCSSFVPSCPGKPAGSAGRSLRRNVERMVDHGTSAHGEGSLFCLGLEFVVVLFLTSTMDSSPTQNMIPVPSKHSVACVRVRGK